MRIDTNGKRTLKIGLVIAFAVTVLWLPSQTSVDRSRVSASSNGPSASHTNAPGESNCTECHTDFDVNSGTGGIQISGLPIRYTPGQQIQLTVTTSQKDAVIYGFQLTAVDAAGRKAGEFSYPAVEPQPLQIVTGIVEGNDRDYIEHTIDGIVPTMFGSKTWEFTWTAPKVPMGWIGFYAAGNGSNSDGTPSGDYIYTNSDTTTSGAPVYDFDGDGKTDVSIFRPSVGEWWYLRSVDGGNRAFQFGNSADTIVPGDYTGDGKTDVAFWRPTTGEWFILRSNDGSYYSFPFGTTGDIPAPSDYDGDGITDAAVYRPASSTWFILNSHDLSVTITTFGIATDKPVPADYDGDGKSDIAIFRPSLGEWWYLRSIDGGNRAFQFGGPADRPVQGDFTGDGKADLAFWRPSSGEWFVLRSENGSYFSFPFGLAGDIPSPGDYDGDGLIDATVFRPSSNTWFSNTATAGTIITTFGSTGDQPVPSAYVP